MWCILEGLRIILTTMEGSRFFAEKAKQAAPIKDDPQSIEEAVNPYRPVLMSDTDEAMMKGTARAATPVSDLGLDEFRIHPTKLKGLETDTDANKRIKQADGNNNGSLDDLRISQADLSFVEPKAQEEKRIRGINHEGLRAEAESEVNALRIALEGLEQNSAQLGLDIISLEEKMTAQSDDAMKNAHGKVLATFKKERLGMEEEIVKARAAFQKAEENYKKYFLQ